MLRKDSARMDLWELAWESFIHEPMGTGPATFEHTFRKNRTDSMVEHLPNGMQGHAHNGFLEVLSSLGIFGAVALTWLWGSLRWPSTKEDHITWSCLIAGSVPLMFNTSALEVFAVMAYLMGTLTVERAKVPVTPVIGRLIAIVSLFIGGCYLYAELRPIAKGYFPCEPEYSAQVSESLAYGLVAAPAKRRELLEWGDKNARRVTACRPNSAAAWMSSAAIYLYGAQHKEPGWKEKAMASLRRAEELDPRSEVVTVLRREIDRTGNPR